MQTWARTFEVFPAQAKEWPQFGGGILLFLKMRAKLAAPRRRSRWGSVSSLSTDGKTAVEPSLPISAQSLDRYRNYLRLLARAEIGPKIRRRVEPSDIVQETLFEAYEKRDQFRGRSEGELVQWLRQMLLHNVLDATRALRRQKRDMTRERLLGSNVHDSTTKLAEWLVADQSSPSQHVAKIEQILNVADAVARLPPDQQDAVVLHHLHGKSLAELATILDRSQTAVAGLLYRGLKQLRHLLSESGL
jgi:RNA polymerase sigma-70 factor (ECF subfamily)